MMSTSFYVSAKSSSGISQVSIDSKLYESRNIFIDDEINSQSALLTCKQIMLLNLEDPNKPINLYVKSPGGEIVSGKLIYDVIQGSAAPVNTICFGNAYSMGAVIVACGTGTRYILPHSKLLCHQPLISGGISGNASTIEEISKDLNKEKNNINELLSKHTGKSIEEVTKATSYNHYYTAEEAVNFGLVDCIGNINEIMRGVKTNG